MTQPKAASTDQYGSRVYRIPDPTDGADLELWSVTRLIDLLAKPALTTWKMKMVASGLSRRPDLVALATTDPYNASKQAIDAARDAANMGTAVHGLTEAADNGTLGPLETLPDNVRGHLGAYQQAMESHGWHVVAAEQTVAHVGLGYAGTFDRILDFPDYGRVVADIKTGARVYPEVALQLAALANAQGLYHPDAGHAPMPDGLRLDLGLVIHLTDKACKIIPVDLTDAWEAFQAVCAIRRFQATKPIGKALKGLTPAKPPVTVPTADPFAGIDGHTPAPGPRYLIDDRRDWIRERVRTLVDHSPDTADLLRSLWPKTPDGVPAPTLRANPKPDAELIDQIAKACDEVESRTSLPFAPPDPGAVAQRAETAAPSDATPRPVVDTLIARLEALPDDLALAVTALAAEAGIPNLQTNPTAEQVDQVDRWTVEAEDAWSQRKASVASAAQGWDDEMWTAALALIGDQPERWTATQAESLGALSAAIDADVVGLRFPDVGDPYFDTTADAAERLIDLYGSKSDVLAAGRAVATELGCQTPRSSDQVAADPLLAARLAAERQPVPAA